MTDKRTQTWRRDLNDAVRDESGTISFSKIGTMAGQFIAGKYLLEHWEKVILNWDTLTILFSVLIAPELFKKLLNMKYGGVDAPQTVTTTTAAAVTTTTESTDDRSGPSAGQSGKPAPRVPRLRGQP